MSSRKNSDNTAENSPMFATLLAINVFDSELDLAMLEGIEVFASIPINQLRAALKEARESLLRNYVPSRLPVEL